MTSVTITSCAIAMDRAFTIAVAIAIALANAIAIAIALAIQRGMRPSIDSDTDC